VLNRKLGFRFHITSWPANNLCVGIVPITMSPLRKNRGFHPIVGAYSQASALAPTAFFRGPQSYRVDDYLNISSEIDNFIQSLMDAEKRSFEEISLAVFATGWCKRSLRDGSNRKSTRNLSKKHCTLLPLVHHESLVTIGLPVSSFPRP